MSKFKVGDKVRYINDDKYPSWGEHVDVKAGGIYTIDSFTSCGTYLRLAERMKSHPSHDRHTSAFELVEDKPAGLKYDEGKTRWDLLLFGLRTVLKGAAQVLTFGAAKYKDDSWQEVPNGKKRYTAAMMRHLDEAIADPSSKDAESGLLHADHFVTNALFIAYLIRQEVK